LEEAADRRLAGYSKGMLQRIGLAQSLVHDPRLIVLDEPTAGVDPAGSRKIRDLVLDLKRLGKTIILSSHLLEQVQEVCDRVGILARGKMVREGVLGDLISIDDQLEMIFSNPVPGLEDDLAAAAAARGAKLLRAGHPRTTLERLFLETTGDSDDSHGKGVEK
jgi:ABC-2 type transport system ATP-binding protein